MSIRTSLAKVASLLWAIRPACSYSSPWGSLTFVIASHPPVGLHLQDALLAREVERARRGQLQARELVVALIGREGVGACGGRGRVAGRRRQRRRVVDVDPAVGGEVVVGGNPLQAVLVVRVDRDRAGERGGRVQRGEPHAAVARGVQDAPV